MLHAEERALQRYNKELGEYGIKQIINSIKNKEYLEAGTAIDDPEKKFVYVKFENIPYKVLYTGEKKIRLITIYPINVEEYNNLVEEKRINKYIKYLEERGYKCQKL